MNEREKAIESLVRKVRVSPITARMCADVLGDAGLLSTQDHVDALKACEVLDRDWAATASVYSAAAKACADIGARSLAAKAAAQESTVERVKRAYKAAEGFRRSGIAYGSHGMFVPREVIEALDALVKEGE